MDDILRWVQTDFTYSTSSATARGRGRGRGDIHDCLVNFSTVHDHLLVHPYHVQALTT